MNQDKLKLDDALGHVANVLIEKDIEYAKSLDTSSVIIPQSTLRKIRKNMHSAKNKTNWWKLPSAFKKVIVAMLCICTVSFALCMAHDSTREAFLNIFINEHEKHSDVFYNSEINSPKTLETYKAPSLQPSDSQKRILMEGKDNYIVGYFKNNERILTYQQMIIGDESSSVNNEQCAVTDTSVNKFPAKLFEYEDGTRTLTWHDNSYAYIIYSQSPNITSKEIIMIAESVK